MTTVHETCRIPPPPCAAAELSLPLSFFDLIWLHFHPIRRLLFYRHPCSEPEFFDAVVPKLKQSLSLTLKHYLPVAGNLLHPLNTDENKPLIRYVSGDTVPLIVAVSTSDFDELTGNHARESDQFYNFMPEMPPSRDDGEFKLVPLVALQVTLFSGRGICIGLSNHHCLGDARSVVGFISAWAEINKFNGGDEEFLSRNGECLPLFDRSVLGENSSEINNMFWGLMKKIPSTPHSFPLPTNRVRSSFPLCRSDITKLKNIVLSKNRSLNHVSSFVVTAAYVWSCMVKSRDETGDESETELFFFPADGRGRRNAMVDPPVPANYFGNCLGFGMAAVERKEVAGDSGFLIAAEAIADHIKNKINNGDEFLKFSDDWISEMSKLMGKESLGVSGSAKFDLLNANFGWGKASKLEVLSMDGEKYSMSLCNSSDDSGGLVVGLSLPAERMKAFEAIFTDGLKSRNIECNTKV